jgi:hypothetical protein
MRRIARLLALAASLLLSAGLRAAAPPAAASSPDASWLTKAQQNIAQREYRASENGQGLQAPNRAHDLRTYFDPNGIRVYDRTAAESRELLRLSLAGVGRGEAITAAPFGDQVVAHESRVEIRRPGIVEWFENSPAGLEQGFTLDARPAGEGPLALVLSLRGATASRRADALVIRSDGGRELSYGRLSALDARGRSLPSHFELASATAVRLSVDDRGATYPVVIDPTLSDPYPPPQLRILGAESSDRLGFSVANAGDVNGDGIDDVIVSAPYFDAGQINEGAAFVFLGSPARSGSATPATAATQLESDQEFANLGESVAGAGDVNGDGYADVIVGDPNYGNGAAFVFLGSATSIADGNPATAATRITADPADMPACPGGGNAGFGVSVAGAGDVNGDGYADVIVGAPRYPPCSSVSGILGKGAAFVFTGSASGIADASSLTAATRLEGTDPQGWFGASVAGAGDVNYDQFADVIVAAPLYDGTESDEGAAFVFLGSSLGIASGSDATASARIESNQAYAHLGTSVASADLDHDGYSDVIVGAPLYDRVTGSGADEGAAFAFRGGAAGIASGGPDAAFVHVDGDQAGADVGWSVAGGIRTDHDTDDIVAGAPWYSAGQEHEGAVLRSSGWFADEDNLVPRIESNQAGAQLGSTLAVGDFNGDGRRDLIVGAPLYDGDQIDEGAAFVYLLPEPHSLLALVSGAALLTALRRSRRA